uniref:Uncharacterized protein n=1 Tax=Papilio xuthus TaxID=66420 RepID=I4DLP9_PAPXU|nr:unknown unsecreted protein [Papilio xuthus]
MAPYHNQTIMISRKCINFVYNLTYYLSIDSTNICDNHCILMEQIYICCIGRKLH